MIKSIKVEEIDRNEVPADYKPKYKTGKAIDRTDLNDVQPHLPGKCSCGACRANRKFLGMED